MGHWGPKCHGGKPLQPRNAPPTGSQHGKSRCPPRNHNHCHGWGGKTDAMDVIENHSPQDEIALHYIQPNMTVGNTHPKEIIVGDVHAPWCKAYTTIQLPASASRKEQPHSMSRSIPELEAMCYPSMCFDTFTQTRSAQLACPIPWIMSVPDSLPTTDPIYLHMVHSVGPSHGSQTTLVLNCTG